MSDEGTGQKKMTKPENHANPTAQDGNKAKANEARNNAIVGEWLKQHDEAQYRKILEAATKEKSRDEAAKAKALKDLFSVADRDRNGQISRSELERLFRNLCGSSGSAALSEAELDDLFKQADTNSDGCLQYKEFVNWLFDIVETNSTEEVLNAALDTTDAFRASESAETGF